MQTHYPQLVTKQKVQPDKKTNSKTGRECEATIALSNRMK